MGTEGIRFPLTKRMKKKLMMLARINFKFLSFLSMHKLSQVDGESDHGHNKGRYVLLPE